jgi:segregation and condensation protein B
MITMDNNLLKSVIEAALLAAGRPLSIDQLCGLFGEDAGPGRQQVREVLASLSGDYADRGLELKEVASGYRIEIRPSVAQYLAKLWEERPPRYSRALMETLAIVAYRQPVTRGDIEEIRGVAVTTNILRTLLERGWLKVVGYRDVPGKPAMYGTTKEFLDYFGLKQLDELPPLAEVKDLDKFTLQLELAGEGAEEGEYPPGGAIPLLKPIDSGLPEEPATVSDIAEARAAHLDELSDTRQEFAGSAVVVPLKVR